MTGHTDGLHWGYYLDEPGQPGLPVASYHHSDAFQIRVDGADLLEATRLELEFHYRDQLAYRTGDAEHAGETHALLEKQDTVRDLLKPYATGDRQEQGEDYVNRYRSPSLRHPAARTRDDMGIVVPPGTYRALLRRDDGSFGIRESSQAQAPRASDDSFQRWDYCPTVPEAELMTEAALEALKSGFPGTALKLGKDLWAYGVLFQAYSYRLLEAAYDALDRPLLQRYLAIARDHRAECDANRRR
jgi:hypothetical protein